MNNNISDKDKKSWENFISSKEKLPNKDFKYQENFITCTFDHQNEQISKDEDLLPLALTAIKRLEKLNLVNKKLSTETINSIKQLKESSKIADNIASHLNTTISEKQNLFETLDVKKRINEVIKLWKMKLA